MSERGPGIYPVLIGRRWTVAEFIVPPEEPAYWIVLGSEEGFIDDDFKQIGRRIELPNVRNLMEG